MNWFQVLAICASILGAAYGVGLAVSLHEHELRSIADNLDRIASALEDRAEPESID